MPRSSSAIDPLRARRDEEKEKRRQAILDSAERVVAKRGWEDTNFGEIARLARLSRSLVYFYFPTRDELFHAMCDRGLTDLASRFETALAKHKTGLDQVVAMGRAYYAFSQEEPLYFDLLAHFQDRQLEAHAQSAIEERANNHGRSCLQLVAQAIGNGIADGTIRKSIGHPAPAAFTIWSFTHGVIQLSSRKEHMLQEEFKLSARQMVEHSLGLLRGSLAA
jgi:TetR/AcrR family transcriptional regulator